MRCPTCGLDVDPAHALCPQCGTPLAVPHPHAQASWGAGPPPWGGHPGLPHQVPPHQTPPWPQQQPTQPPGPWPEHPDGPWQVLEPGSGPGGRRPPWAWLVAVLAVIFVSAGAAGVILKLAHRMPHLGPGRPPASSAAPDPKSQAAAIDALLTASSASRGRLGPALDQVDGCGDLTAATAALQQVTNERDDQVRRGQALPVNQLPNGDKLHTALVQALTFSWQADQKFVSWARNTAANGCGGHAVHDADWTAAQAASASARTSKQTFVQLWNPIATSYGFQTRTEATF
jgi:hypothetical protein